MQQVGVPNGVCSSFIVFGISNDCGWAFKASPTLWCKAMVHVEVKMSRFWAVFEDDHPEIAQPSPKQTIFLLRRFPLR